MTRLRSIIAAVFSLAFLAGGRRPPPTDDHLAGSAVTLARLRRSLWGAYTHLGDIRAHLEALRSEDCGADLCPVHGIGAADELGDLQAEADEAARRLRACDRITLGIYDGSDEEETTDA